MTSEAKHPQKSPKPDYLLKRLRKEIRKTQRQMARMVGMSLSYWKKMECGDREINLENARRISYATGHSAMELHECPHGRLLQKDRYSPYTRESYERYLDKENFGLSGTEALTNKSNRDPLLSVEDLADADLLRSKLRSGSFIEFLKGELSRPTLTKISCEWDKEGSKEELRKDLNRIVGEGPLIYDDDRFHGIPLSVETADLLDRHYKKEEKVSRKLLNRMLLEDAFPQELKKLSETTVPPEAREDAETVGELATCMVLAAASRGKPQEKAIRTALWQAFEKVRKDFDLEFLTYEQFQKRTSKAMCRGVRRNEQTDKEELEYMVIAVEAPGMLVSRDPKVWAMIGLQPGIPDPSDTGNPHGSDPISLPPDLQKKARKAVPPISRHKGTGKASPKKNKRRKKQ